MTKGAFAEYSKCLTAGKTAKNAVFGATTSYFFLEKKVNGCQMIKKRSRNMAKDNGSTGLPLNFV